MDCYQACEVALVADVFTKSKRSRIMALVHSKNTTPELIVRSTLHRLGYRFSLSSKKLPGKPDIVLSRFQKLIFVHGCFWHQHKGCKASERPSSNSDYWNNKLDRNISRDKKNIAMLKKSGWDVLIIWECQTRKNLSLSVKLAKFMKRPNKRLRSSSASALKIEDGHTGALTIDRNCAP
ncbi:MAG TPA: very short patch repair endonuclease [Fibrobacteres bacterium]|nr:very short patch repair endonuclease [Fibrobacterota bacterium]